MRKHALFATIALASFPSLATAAGVLHSSGGDLEIETQSLKVMIEESVATTEVEQVFKNTKNNPVEAIYDFPLPPRGTFTGLSIWVDGKEVQGEVVARTRAEDVYSQVTGVEVRAPVGDPTAPAPIVTRRRDPGLLETTSGREVRLRLSPVPAHGTQRVRVRYVEPVSVEAGHGRYVFPLASPTSTPARAGEPAHVAVAGKLTCDVLVHSTTPLASVRCPSHPRARVETQAPGEVFHLAFEAEHAPLDSDLEVDFEREAQSAPRIDVVASRSEPLTGLPGTARPGTALLALEPWLPDSPTATRTPREVVFALDASGSMLPHRAAALAALEVGIAALAPEDRFDVVVFSLGARGCAGRLQPATPEARERALTFARSWPFERGTDLRVALEAVGSIVARGDRPRALDLVLVTDASLSDSAALVTAVEEKARAAKVRVFALELGAARAAQGPLERLARRTGGVALVAEDSDARAGARAVAAAVATPCLRSPTLRLEGIALEGILPREAPAVLRAGSPFVLLGRYAKPGRGSAILEGDLPDGRRLTWTLPVELPRTGNAREVERLYAQARADAVLSALAATTLPESDRAALEDELTRVSVEGQILTRATSLLALEGERMFQEFGIERKNRGLIEEDRAAETERREDARRLVEQRQQEARGDQIAQAPTARVWSGRTGGGAGEPLLLGLALAALASTVLTRRVSRVARD